MRDSPRMPPVRWPSGRALRCQDDGSRRASSHAGAGAPGPAAQGAGRARPPPPASSAGCPQHCTKNRVTSAAIAQTESCAHQALAAHAHQALAALKHVAVSAWHLLMNEILSLLQLLTVRTHDQRHRQGGGAPVGVGHQQDAAPSSHQCPDRLHDGAGLARARHAQQQRVVLGRRDPGGIQRCVRCETYQLALAACTAANRR